MADQIPRRQRRTHADGRSELFAGLMQGGGPSRVAQPFQPAAEAVGCLVRDDFTAPIEDFLGQGDDGFQPTLAVVLAEPFQRGDGEREATCGAFRADDDRLELGLDPDGLLGKHFGEQSADIESAGEQLDRLRGGQRAALEDGLEAGAFHPFRDDERHAIHGIAISADDPAERWMSDPGKPRDGDLVGALLGGIEATTVRTKGEEAPHGDDLLRFQIHRAENDAGGVLDDEILDLETLTHDRVAST